MALTQINQPRAQRGPTTLEKIAMGFGIAKDVLGTAFAIPEFIQKNRESKLNQALTRANILQKTDVGKPGEEGTFEVPGVGLRKAKPEVLSASEQLAGVRLREAERRSQPVSPETRQIYEANFPGQKLSPAMTEGVAQDFIKAGISRQIMTPAQQRGLDIQERGVRLREEEAAQKLRVTPGQEAADKQFAKEYQDFIPGGGAADAKKGIGQLSDAISQLEKGEYNFSGPGIGALPKSVRERTHPQSVSVQEAVEEIVQRNLRLILGAQFTEKEGERLIQRAYNINLPEAENIKRLKRLQGQMDQAYQAKLDAAKHWEQYGTLSNYQGTPQFTADDFLNDVPQDDERVAKYAKDNGLSYEQARNIIERRRGAQR